MLIDLSHPIRSDIPLWPGDPPVVIERQCSVDRDGYLLQRLAIGEHSATHVGVAAHVREKGMTVESLSLSLLMPNAFVIDVRDRCDERYQLSVEDVLRWEQEHGTIAPRSAVLLCTGWSERWNDPVAYLGSPDGSRLAWPGFSLEAARFLALERNVIALGIDTHGIDAGDDDALSVNRWWLDGDRYHIENLARLEELPPVGARLFVGVLPVVGGSGAPARVLAVTGS